MARPKRNVLATAAATSTPPDTLSEGQRVVRVIKAMGNYLFNVEQADGKELLVELPAQFRSTFWVKKGSYALVDTQALADRDNKLEGEIVNIVREERAWRKMSYWPPQFSKRSKAPLDSEDDSQVGQMPPSDTDDEV